ncbi:MAG: 4-hydroxy-tetrahydrodipicolinate synthase, partial [Candidatus Gastranaerophilales bacterium]|nr:4-hydroxy-tetrahydrodipicolinate synthase [Candidatus Gastranaerophilales bacterium]
YYNKPNQKGMIEHFSAVAESTDLPIILYNIPGRTGVNMLPETVAYLAEKYNNIVGLKQSFGDMDKVTELKMLCPENFVIYSGDDSLTLPMMSLGAHGVISVASHIFGSEIKSMIRNFKSGELIAARNMHKKLYPVFRNLFVAPNPVPVKAALAYKGLIHENVRKPLAVLSEEEKIELFKIIDSVKAELSEEG